jgi:hypothetical protein
MVTVVEGKATASGIIANAAERIVTASEEKQQQPAGYQQRPGLATMVEGISTAVKEINCFFAVLYKWPRYFFW